MLLGAVPDFASQSRWENFVFGPLAIVLAGLCFLVAHAAAEPARGNAHAAEP